jgi:bacterioferritin-associated ferredoxin
MFDEAQNIDDQKLRVADVRCLCFVRIIRPFLARVFVVCQHGGNLQRQIRRRVVRIAFRFGEFRKRTACISECGRGCEVETVF